MLAPQPGEGEYDGSGCGGGIPPSDGDSAGHGASGCCLGGDETEWGGGGHILPGSAHDGAYECQEWVIFGQWMDGSGRENNLGDGYEDGSGRGELWGG